MDVSRIKVSLTGLLDQDPDARLVVDSTGLVRYANAAASRLLARPAAALLGRPCPFRLPSDGESEVALDGSRQPARLALVRVGPVNWGPARARLVSLRDMTESRRLERTRAEVEDRMRAVELKKIFLSRLSHELRSPLTVVKSAILCLKDGHAGPVTRRQLQFLDMACRNVDRQTRMIDNMLDLARLQSGRASVSLRPLDLAPMLEEVAQEFRLTAGSRLVELEAPPGLPAALGDPELVAQVLRNLLDNALRFCRSKVAVRAAAEPEGVRVTVADDGAGVPKDRLRDLFTEFVQVQRPMGGRGYKGTGLGLAICKEIIREHRGRIWAESPAEGKGARFHFVLSRCDKSGDVRASVAEAEGRIPPREATTAGK